jgi:hypothetical protein
LEAWQGEPLPLSHLQGFAHGEQLDAVTKLIRKKDILRCKFVYAFLYIFPNGAGTP